MSSAIICRVVPESLDGLTDVPASRSRPPPTPTPSDVDVGDAGNGCYLDFSIRNHVNVNECQALLPISDASLPVSSTQVAHCFPRQRRTSSRFQNRVLLFSPFLARIGREASPLLMTVPHLLTVTVVLPLFLSGSEHETRVPRALFCLVFCVSVWMSICVSGWRRDADSGKCCRELGLQSFFSPLSVFARHLNSIFLPRPCISHDDSSHSGGW